MAYRISGEGYSAFFREQEDEREVINDDIEDGYTCLLCNTSYEKDLQLAAELGKTLLERNKELESCLKQHQTIMEDQAQEIEYLRKQTAALREVNDSRLRIYEQLEVSIQDLESVNHRLSTQSANDKKHISCLEGQVEKLETRCEELLRQVEDYERSRQENGSKTNEKKNCDAESQALKEQLSEVRTQNSRQAAKIDELQDTIDTVTQENVRLEEMILSLQRKQEEMRLMDQVRQGEICRRCLRAAEDISMTGDEDDASVIDSLINDDNYQSFLRDSVADVAEENNPYRILVEKYEALLKVQSLHKPQGTLRPHQDASTKCMSLQEELAQSGEFSSFLKEEDDGEYEATVRAAPGKIHATPDFSETETSSSGFADETINKSTQTEALVPPGSFLCSITDGDDCKFSIYDEASPIETRFRKTPEYKKLFREIFDVLKRAAEAKDEGENLPLLEDMTPMCEAPPKVPPVTPAVEDAPQLPEPVNSHDSNPPKRDILEHLSQGVGGSSKKHHRSRRHRNSSVDHSPSPAAVVNGAGSGTGGIGVFVSTKLNRRRKETRRSSHAHSSSPSSANNTAAHHSSAATSNDSGRSTPEVKRLTWCVGDTPPCFVAPSLASQDVARLKQLEKSYAEVLRIGRQHVGRK